jgi:hypothetical protein
MVNVFNLVGMYLFNVDGKKAIVPASSMLAAIEILENEGYSKFNFIKKL